MNIKFPTNAAPVSAYADKPLAVSDSPALPTAAPARPALAPVAAPAETDASAAVSHEQVKRAIEQINAELQSQTPNLEFTVDQDNHQTIVKVVDRQTGDVIRQMPSKEALEIADAIDRMMSLRVSQKA